MEAPILSRCMATKYAVIMSWLYAQVLMKDIVTPVPQEEVRHVIRKCLENAALVNYTKVSEMTKIEGKRH